MSPLNPETVLFKQKLTLAPKETKSISHLFLMKQQEIDTPDKMLSAVEKEARKQEKEMKLQKEQDDRDR
jgi:hypothetical protein